MDTSERWKALAILVFAFAFLAFVSRPYISIDSFGAAQDFNNYLAGQPFDGSAIFYSIIAPLSSAIPIGMLAPVFGALAVLFMYLGIRQLYGADAALFASALLASAAGFTGFAAAGIFSAAAPAFAFLALGVFFITLSISKKMPAHALIGAAAFAIAALVHPLAAVPAAIFGIALAFQAYASRNDAGAYVKIPAAAALAGAIIAIALGGTGALETAFATGMDTMAIRVAVFSLFAMLPLSLAALAPYLLDKKKHAPGHSMSALPFAASLLSIIAAPFSPYFALLGATIACAFAFKWATGGERGHMTEMAFVALAVLSLVFPLLFGRGFDEVRSFAFALLMGGVAGSVLKLYEERGVFKSAAFMLCAFLLFYSMAAGSLFAQAQVAEERPEVLGALEWSSANIPAGQPLYAFMLGPTVQYVSGHQSGDKDAAIASFLLGSGNASELRAAGVEYLLVDAAYFDDLTKLRDASGKQSVRMDSFVFAGYAQDEAGTVYAFFYGLEDRLVARADPQTGQLLGNTYSIQRGSGETLEIAASRALLLRGSDEVTLDGNDRIVYPGESFNTNLFKLFFGEVGGMERIYPSGEGSVRIYKVS